MALDPARRRIDELTNASGLIVRADTIAAAPRVTISVPNEVNGENAVVVLLPEHVTVRRHGSLEVEHLFLADQQNAVPRWVRVGNALQWQANLPYNIVIRARISLESDGVLYHYDLSNRSNTTFDSVQVVTDPRMISPLFHDVRLERTFVHTPEGFSLLASDTPERVTMPLGAWLPNRYRVSFRWPVPANRTEMQPDGIRFYNASFRTDLPAILTTSADHRWLMATFSRDPGNVWTNPELTCQHADSEVSLPARSYAVVEEKTLLMRGTSSDAEDAIQRQRNRLR